jgi:beta-galactosidase
VQTSGKPKRLSRVVLAFVCAACIIAGTTLYNRSAAQGTIYEQPMQSTQPTLGRIDIDFNVGWKFRLGDVSGAESPSFDAADWISLDLPHTWNNQDGEKGGSYHRGVGWYRKHYTVSPDYSGRQFYLQFNGSNLVTDVYINGTLLGEHQGGYSTFRMDATPYIKIGQDNVIAVKVNNVHNADVPPLDADYTFFGGIYRGVHLIVTDKVHMQMLDYGSSGLFIQQSNVSATSADLRISSEVRNDDTTPQEVTLKLTILDARDQIVQTLTSQQTVNAHSDFTFVQTTTVMNPHLWNGKQDPYLYQVLAQVQRGSTVRDTVVQPLGLRFFHLDPNQGFFLNGVHLDLHGVNMQGQERPGVGWAITTKDLDEDFGFVQDIGATAIRLAHYDHDQHIYDLADNNGIIVWAEIPLINKITASTNFTHNVEQQLTELIRQNYNHPSVTFWSIGNEVPASPKDPNPLLSQLNTLAHAEDPTRLTTLAVCCVDDTDPIAMHTDTRGYNKYFGWYGGNTSDFDAWATNLHQKHPDLTFAVSEYGGGASIYQHQDNPAPPNPNGHFHPEEYQAILHEVAWQSMKNKPYIWGKFVWNMFDFATASRNEGDTAGRNDKGLVTYDRQTRKDAFYWYKANWSSSAFVYITDRRYTQRMLATTDIKIYSNTNAVDLTLNGVSLGSKTSTNHIFIWSAVHLAQGDNTIQATGTLNGNIYTDVAHWSLTHEP